ncbi:hypothetical protein SKAU_G00302390 [Synaphobranchus kaupii]|uniref:Uncharacterized protein n=1 Tax=Synaphobranchus kaupii TaxID=118154 RepID=A0A9Q1INF7_SYNKA|nr:hypothetical protein SKAU_G00302390 [Synaphobranchus kaupii]
MLEVITGVGWGGSGFGGSELEAVVPEFPGLAVNRPGLREEQEWATVPGNSQRSLQGGGSRDGSGVMSPRRGSEYSISASGHLMMSPEAPLISLGLNGVA